MPGIIDISVPLQPGLPQWPGSDPLQVRQVDSLAAGAVANVTSLQAGSHTGTHIDAPLHFIDGGKTTDEIPLEKLVGPCQVLGLSGRSAITAADLEQAGVQPGIGKLLFRTDNSRFWDHPVHPFREDFCALTLDACRWVVERGIHLVGIDYLSIQLYQDSFEPHVVLLSEEVVILEGLDLRDAAPGIYKLTCLPLKVRGVEGMMARAVLETV